MRLLLVVILACAAAHAGEGNTLKGELRMFTEETASQCASVKDQLARFKVKKDPLTGYNLKDAVQSLCVCMPAKTEALSATFSAEQLAQVVDEDEFRALFNAAVIDKCAAEQMRMMYSDDCGKRFKKPGLDVPRYCACMKGVVDGYSEAEATAISAAASDYLPRAADAEKNGQTVPTRPPVLESYFQADQRCKAKP